MAQQDQQFSRRAMLKSAAIGSALLSPLMPLPAFAIRVDTRKTKSSSNQTVASPDEPFGPFTFHFSDGEKVSYAGGSAAEVSVKQLPVSTGLAGVNMTLKPGATRELHWHAIAAEWAYMLEGNARITIIDPEGRSEIVDFGPGDVWFFPKGFGHSIQALDKGAHFILIFDSGYFSEFGTFSITDWAAHTPKNVLAMSTGMPESAFASAPNHEAYIVTGPVPPPIPLDAPRGSTLDAPSSHKFRMSSQKPDVDVAGGTVTIVSSVQFPGSTTITGVIEVIKPRCVRELHWHPNADEWQYYIQGRGKMAVFGSHARISIAEVEKNDVGYVPQGYGHYIENTGDEDLVVLIGLNNGFYQDISFSDWIATQPNQLLIDHFGSSLSTWAGKPQRKLFMGTH